MLRGEKRSLPIDGAPVLAGAVGMPSSAAAVAAVSSGGPAAKKSKEKMPDFDWTADNYALTWRLVEELRKPENKTVIFPDQESMPVKTGDTKEDVYRRIAKVVHPEAYTQDPQIAGSRMKNKNVAMWKEYSGYCRRLQELCTTHQVVIPANGPDEAFPQEIQTEWRKIIISMPVFQTLRSFMPVRPEEKPKAPTVKAQRGMTNFLPPHTDEMQVVEHHRDGPNSASYSGPAQSPPMKRASVTRDVVLGTAEGQKKMNGRGNGNGNEPHIFSQPQVSLRALKISLTDYLELRRSYQEDVRLGIFTASETKNRLEVLDKQRPQPDSVRAVPAPPSSSASTMSTFSQVATPQISARAVAPDPLLEHTYEEKAFLLGFRKPVTTSYPLSRLTSKEFFREILVHAVDCELQECRLDSQRKTPQLSFVPAANPHDLGVPVETMFMTHTGLVPLIQHPLAACARFASPSVIHVMDLPLVIRTGNGWETTVWDFATTVIAASLRRRLTIEEINSAQANSHAASADPTFRQQFQLLNESSTFFDVLRAGLLTHNKWMPMGQIDEPMDH